MVQLAYNLYMDESFAGMQDGVKEGFVSSYAAEGNIFFGAALVKGTNADKQVKLPEADDEFFIGVALHSHTIPQDLQGVAQYEDKRTVNVIEQGRVHVPVVQNVSTDDPVYYVFSGADAGKFRKDDGGSPATAILIPRARFVNGASSGQVALIHLK